MHKSLCRHVFIYLEQIPRSKIAEPIPCPEVWIKLSLVVQLKILDIYYIFKKHKKSIKGGVKKADQLVISEHKFKNAVEFPGYYF